MHRKPAKSEENKKAEVASEAVREEAYVDELPKDDKQNPIVVSEVDRLKLSNAQLKLMNARTNVQLVQLNLQQLQLQAEEQQIVYEGLLRELSESYGFNPNTSIMDPESGVVRSRYPG